MPHVNFFWLTPDERQASLNSASKAQVLKWLKDGLFCGRWDSLHPHFENDVALRNFLAENDFDPSIKAVLRFAEKKEGHRMKNLLVKLGWINNTWGRDEPMVVITCQPDIVRAFCKIQDEKIKAHPPSLCVCS